MPFGYGGFWGTPREDAWRRRKEREYEREAAVRSQERRERDRLAEEHGRELEGRDRVIELSSRLLKGSRYDAERAKAEAKGRGRSDDDDGDGRKRRRVAENGDEEGGGGGVSAEAAEDDREEEESVRETLLATSFAMFDTLFGTRSFDPATFVSFLVRRGERALAEQISLSAVELTGGDGKSVKFVLEEMIPESDEPEDLMEALKALLRNKDICTEASGKEALMEWEVKHGNTDDAFAAALLITNEVDRLKKALPLATTAERKTKLKASCNRLLSASIIDVFEDDEWPVFVSCLLQSPKLAREGWYTLRYETYVNFAALEVMTSERKKVVAEWALRGIFQGAWKGNHVHEYVSNPYSRGVYKLEGCISNLFDTKRESTERAEKTLTELSEALKKLRPKLNTIGLDPMPIIASELGRGLALPPPNECSTAHGTWQAAFKCTKCKSMIANLACDLGILEALRQHSLTSGSAPFHRIGLPCSPADAVVVASPGKSRFLAEAAEALLGKPLEHIKRYCAT